MLDHKREAAVALTTPIQNVSLRKGGKKKSSHYIKPLSRPNTNEEPKADATRKWKRMET